MLNVRETAIFASSRDDFNQWLKYLVTISVVSYDCDYKCA